MNGFEVFFVIFISALAIYQASWNSSILYFISCYQLRAAKKFATFRMADRKRNCKIAIFFLLVSIIAKVLMICLLKKHKIDQKNVEEYKTYMRSFGVSVDKIDEADPSQFHYDYPMTFLFEMCFFVFLIIYYWITIRTEEKIMYLD